ncbi:MAG: type II toxin-antitoxin system PemK/MazF family toxin [Bacteroidetes bacterium]|nr:MAG: type II toxin-antitoxin system PemK/MazF family toxin [Bacteroidota bacterium]
MKQRDIYWANLNPTKGNEQRDIRPVVIVSGNAMNDHLGICIICPLSTKIKHYAGCLVLEKNALNQLPEDSEVLTFQIRTLAKQRLREKIGEISEEQLRVIRQGLVEILTY